MAHNNNRDTVHISNTEIARRILLNRGILAPTWAEIDTEVLKIKKALQARKICLQLMQQFHAQDNPYHYSFFRLLRVLKYMMRNDYPIQLIQQ